jgi:hypothetical protein
MRASARVYGATSDVVASTAGRHRSEAEDACRGVPRNLAERGRLRVREDVGPFDVQRRYFTGRSDGYYAFEQAHLACALVA